MVAGTPAQTDWAAQIGPEKIVQLRDLLGDLVSVLGVRYSPQLGGIREETFPATGR
jgi:hypothetical protein